MNATATVTILTNDFHNTEARTLKTRDELDAILMKHRTDRTPAEQSLIRRINKALCGMSDCRCSGELGDR